MNTEQFLRIQGWEISGPDAYYPKGGYPHIHVRLTHADRSGKMRSMTDIGGGHTHAAVSGAYRAMTPFVDFIAFSRGAHGGGTNLVTNGAITGDGHRYSEILVKEIPRYSNPDGAVNDLSDIRNKLYYLMAEF